MHSRVERLIGHNGTETRPILLREAAVGNLPQWADEGFRLVKHCCKRRMTLRVTVQCVTVSYQKGTAKYVPAAAVIRMFQALSGFIGRKASADGYLSLK